MKVKYRDLVEQTFDWPQEEFYLEKGQLHFHDIPMMDLVEKYGSPLKFSFLPKIGQNIEKARGWFKSSMKKLKYKGNYHYCYVTKSSHFHFVMDEVLKTGAFLETSSAFDLDLVKSLHKQGKLKKNHTIICNGFKREEYCKNISEMVADGFTNLTPILDNKNEVELLTEIQ